MMAVELVEIAARTSDAPAPGRTASVSTDTGSTPGGPHA